ncbi:hypothetical protein GCM10023108_46730 [Saccharopolyspora hordei]
MGTFLSPVEPHHQPVVASMGTFLSPLARERSDDGNLPATRATRDVIAVTDCVLRCYGGSAARGDGVSGA